MSLIRLQCKCFCISCCQKRDVVERPRAPSKHKLQTNFSSHTCSRKHNVRKEMKKLENVGNKILQPEYFGNYNNIGLKLGSVSTASVAKVAPHLGKGTNQLAWDILWDPSPLACTQEQRACVTCCTGVAILLWVKWAAVAWTPSLGEMCGWGLWGEHSPSPVSPAEGAEGQGTGCAPHPGPHLQQVPAESPLQLTAGTKAKDKLSRVNILLISMRNSKPII